MVNPIGSGGQIPAYGSEGGAQTPEQQKNWSTLHTLVKSQGPFQYQGTTYDLPNDITAVQTDCSNKNVQIGNLQNLCNDMTLAKQLLEGSFPAGGLPPKYTQVDYDLTTNINLLNSSIKIINNGPMNSSNSSLIGNLQLGCCNMSSLLLSLVPASPQDSWSDLQMYLTEGSCQFQGKSYNLQDSINAVVTDASRGKLQMGNLENLSNAVSLVKALYEGSLPAGGAPANHCMTVHSQLTTLFNNLNSLISQIKNGITDVGDSKTLSTARSIANTMSHLQFEVIQNPPPGAKIYPQPN